MEREALGRIAIYQPFFRPKIREIIFLKKNKVAFGTRAWRNIFLI